jgi:hypothetical protein
MDSRSTHLKGARWEKYQSRRPWGSSAAAVLRAQSRAAGAVQGAVGGADADKPVVTSFVILRSPLLNEGDLSLKVLVLVINVALAYTAVPLLRRRRRRRRRRRYGHGGGGSGCSILALRRSPVNRSFASLSFRALRVIPAEWAWWWWFWL